MQAEQEPPLYASHKAQLARQKHMVVQARAERLGAGVRPAPFTVILSHKDYLPDWGDSSMGKAFAEYH